MKSALLSVLKDDKTLAYYNIMNGSTLELSIKERGGRKKWINKKLSIFLVYYIFLIVTNLDFYKFLLNYIVYFDVL